MQESLSVLSLGMGWYPVNQGNGLDRVYHELRQHSPGAGLDLTSLVISSPDVRDGSVVIVDESLGLPQRLRAVRSAFREHVGDCELVASHFALYARPVLADLGDRPLVVHFHGPWADESRVEGDSWVASVLKRALEKQVYRRADRLITLSSAFKSVLVDRYGVQPSKIDIIPGGVDLERFNTGLDTIEAKRRLGWSEDRRVVVSVRRLVRRVGLEQLVEAVAELGDEFPDLVLKIGGRGPHEEELKRLADTLGVASRVEFLGFVPEADLPVVFAAGDVSVVPSQSLEGFGLIAAESLASGTPALVTPVGGLPEVVSGLDESLVFDSSSSTSIAVRLSDWLSADLRLPGASACRKYAEDHYDWRVVAQKTRSTYEQALRSRNVG